MPDDDPTPRELEEALRAVGQFLHEHDRPESEGVMRAADEAHRGDAHGAHRYVRLNGAILDLYFSPVNGNAPDEAHAERLNAELAALHRRAFALAERVRRSFR